MTAGIVAIAVGVYFAIFRNKSWVYEPTGSRVFHRSLYFCGGDKERAFHFIDTAHNADMPHPRSQGKLMLDVFSSADDNMVCMQLCEYTNFSYEPLTSPRLVTGEKARPPTLTPVHQAFVFYQFCLSYSIPCNKFCTCHRTFKFFCYQVIHTEYIILVSSTMN